MSASATITAPAASRAASEVVVGRALTKRYGEGDVAVDALRGVDIDLHARQLHRDHGPLGLRQVDADAHPRRARPAHQRLGRDRRHPARHAGTTTSSRCCAAPQIGFIFQSYNLLPVLTPRRTSSCRSASPATEPTPSGSRR